MKYFNELQEGVYDPNIFKAFFIAGGPGSGKSFVVRRTTGGLGLRVINSDDAFEHQLKKANLSLKMPASETEPRDIVRARAKQTTASRKAGYLEGRLGIIIDGTVDNPCFIVPALDTPVYVHIENPAVSLTLPELSILPTPVALASLLNDVPAFQHQAT